MKKDLHPAYYPNAQIKCACGNVLTVGSTVEDVHVEVCSKCHPFYTGTQRIVDAARRVDKYQKRIEQQASVAGTRKGRKTKRVARSLKKKTSDAEKADAEKTAV